MLDNTSPVSDSAVSQLGVIADIDGQTLTSEDRDFLIQPELAGIILFSRNYSSVEQLTELTASIKALRPDLLISVDQEGGRVQRFREGFQIIPPMLTFESIWEKKPDQALSVVADMAELLALECRLAGVDLSYAPVLDIEIGVSKVIGDRAFGRYALSVISLSRAWCQGMSRVGLKAVGKHFPGHGAVEADSHHQLPVDTRSYEALLNDMQPFAALIREEILTGIMPAHVVFSAVDQSHTAGFSSVWLQQILRKELGFSGVIFSDDLSMAAAAASGNYATRALAAASAGANALLACNDRVAAQQVIDAVRTITPSRPRLDLSTWCLPMLTESERKQWQNRRQQLIEILTPWLASQPA